MAYTFGARLDNDSYALTTIDEDHGTASTKGEINGVPFEGGGGGSGDLSTAEITFVNNTGGYLDEQYFNGVPGIEDGEEWYGITDILHVPSMNVDTSVQVTIPLYKNSYWTYDENITPSGKVISETSGDITIEESHNVHITGDCTITIS